MNQKEKNKQYSEDVESGIITAMSDPKYWARRRSKWDEWGSPVGLGLWLISLAIVVLLLHIAGLF